MRTSLHGSMIDAAAVLAEHRLSWVTVESVYVSSQGWVSVNIKAIEVLADLAQRLRVSRKQIQIEPTAWDKRKLTIEFRSRGIRWCCNTEATQSQAELIGVDGEQITTLPAPKRVGLPATKRKQLALIPPLLFGGDA